MGKSILFLNYLAFFILFITGFVFIFQANASILGYAIVFVTNTIFMLYMATVIVPDISSKDYFVAIIARCAVMVTSILHFTSLIFILMMIYNGLIRKKNQVDNAFGAVDVQLKERYDLIPNLVSTVKNYMAHEQNVLTQLTQLRTQALAASSTSSADLSKINQQIEGALKSIMVSVENYPELKANENFLSLQSTLNEIEAQIAAARRTFNSAVTEFNIALESFPSNIIANMMGLQRKHVFEIKSEERENINIKNMFKE